MSWLRKARKAVKSVGSHIAKAGDSLADHWRRGATSMVNYVQDSYESFEHRNPGALLLKGARGILPDVDVTIPPDAPLPAPSSPGQALDLSIGRKRRAASGRDSLKINRIGAVSKSVGVNVPR